jgi:hypothetical protein
VSVAAIDIEDAIAVEKRRRTLAPFDGQIGNSFFLK